jgi:membrane associated rhomboid family serine protease
VPRRGLQVPRFLTFGDRVPAAVGLVIVLMAGGSIFGWLDPGLLSAAALVPAAIFEGELWRVVTWPLFSRDPLGLLFGALMLYWLGQQLAYAWGERRFLLRFLAFTLFAGVGTAVIAIAWPPARAPHVGLWPVANALLLSWALLYPDREVNIWGILPLKGKTVALLVVAGTFLYGIAGGGVGGIGAFTPHLCALALAWALSRRRGGSPLRDARRWWSERDAKRRARHLKVVKKDGEEDRPRWLN